MAMAELDDFHHFPRLPPEIREMIWHFALPAMRIIYAGSFPFPTDELHPANTQRARSRARRRSARASAPHCPRSGRDLLPRALREDTYHWSGDYAPVPALLHACAESRHMAIESGYVLTLAEQQQQKGWRLRRQYDSPRRIWFNPETDYVQISTWEDSAERAICNTLGAISVVTRAAVEVFEFDQCAAALQSVRALGHLDEVLLVIKHTYPHPEDCVIVDCGSANVSDEATFWLPPQFYYNCLITPNREPDAGRLSFYRHFLSHQDRYIEDLRQEEDLLSRRSGSAVPRVRFVYVTDLDGKMDLERFRQLPQLED